MSACKKTQKKSVYVFVGQLGCWCVHTKHRRVHVHKSKNFGPKNFKSAAFVHTGNVKHLKLENKEYKINNTYIFKNTRDQSSLKVKLRK